MSMLKQVLGVQKQTTNDGVYLELGKTPLSFDAKKFAIKNWERITRGKANVPLLASYQESRELDLPWITSIKCTLESIGFLNFYMGDFSTKPPFVYKKTFQRLSDIFHQEAFSRINNERSKLRTYGSFKKEQGYESYLTDIKNTNVRKNVTKFRLSNHKLMIEVGHHQKLDTQERTCPFCPNAVEDELHFLLHCPTYNIQRSALLEPITSVIHNFSLLPDSQKFELVMCRMDSNICNFISNAMDIRPLHGLKPCNNVEHNIQGGCDNFRNQLVHFSDHIYVYNVLNIYSLLFIR